MDFHELTSLIQTHQSFALFCHINPDGDCIGAVLAMYQVLKKMGKQVYPISFHGVPSFLRFLPHADEIIPGDKAKDLTAEVAIILDCGDEKRVGEELIPVLRRAAKRISIDHHISNNFSFADLNYVDPHASSASELIFRFLQQENSPLNSDIATCLYTGIMYDTGRFKHPTTTPQVFQVCSELVAAGADPSQIAIQVYDGRSVAHLRLLGYSLSNIHIEENNALAWAVIERDRVEAMGAKDEDFDGVVEMLGAHEGCEIHIIFSAGTDSRVRVSMRSKGNVDVSRIASKFGGGGHRAAAGLRLSKPMAEVIDMVLNECRERLSEMRGA